MSTPEDDAGSAFERRTRALLEESAASLDGRLRSRLTQARHAALGSRRRNVARRAWWQWAPAGAVAVALLSVLLYVRLGGGVLPSMGPLVASSPAASSPADDLEMLADADAMQLAEDAGDYEFYEWAAAAADQPAGAGS